MSMLRLLVPDQVKASMNRQQNERVLIITTQSVDESNARALQHAKIMRWLLT